MTVPPSRTLPPPPPPPAITLAGRCADVASEWSELPIKESVAAKAPRESEKTPMLPQLTVKEKAKHCLSNCLQQHHTGCSRYQGV
ncbi:hypothetical protein HPB47_012502 [Ixodes persulcatus]|uniref:Uncharacterized protein n=1 Tax=Ixodes persulcatus TaxID=34615 RepID=A0AC60NTD3_IXOPE|nr:hypothetical protein HPB47_012502 [Ixodes persulcatus]